MTNSFDSDIRWKQRFANYKKAFTQLTQFIDKEQLNDMEKQGLVKAFEYTYELAWNVMKDYFTYEQAEESIYGSRDAIRLAFRRGLILDGENWMDMVQSRIKSSHTYNEDTANEITAKIINIYYQLFKQFLAKMQSLE